MESQSQEILPYLFIIQFRLNVFFLLEFGKFLLHDGQSLILPLIGHFNVEDRNLCSDVIILLIIIVAVIVVVIRRRLSEEEFQHI